MHNPNIVNSNSNIVNSNSQILVTIIYQDCFVSILILLMHNPNIVNSNSQVIPNIGSNTLSTLFCISILISFPILVCPYRNTELLLLIKESMHEYI